ncbi:MAG: hypothetical protein JKY37_20800 [Nannocystaceae bacterium]|nr:hypothetical protein [Nannocystaceae bacterium]
MIVGLMFVLSPQGARASDANLSPCIGQWEGMAEDPWDPGPYAMKVNLTGGVQQCATVTYVELCTSRWVDCTAGNDWVKATERLIDPGVCAEGAIEVRCESADTLHVRWRGGPGIMETTLHRAPSPPNRSNRSNRSKARAASSKAEPPPKTPSTPTPPERPEASSCNVSGGRDSWTWLLLMVLSPRCRRRSIASCQHAGHGQRR